MDGPEDLRDRLSISVTDRCEAEKSDEKNMDDVIDHR